MYICTSIDRVKIQLKIDMDIEDIHISTYRDNKISFKELALVFVRGCLALLKSVGQASGLEAQAGVGAAVLRQNSFLSRKSQFC